MAGGALGHAGWTLAHAARAGSGSDRRVRGEGDRSEVLGCGARVSAPLGDARWRSGAGLCGPSRGIHSPAESRRVALGREPSSLTAAALRSKRGTFSAPLPLPLPPSLVVTLAPTQTRRERASVTAGAVSRAVSLSSWASGGKYREREAMEATRKGMDLFKRGDVAGSIVQFDAAMELDPRQKPYLWQRGLSLYYADRLAEAADQFRADVAVNPNDTEESIWCFLAEARQSSPQEARASFLEVGRDSRPIMRLAYDTFREGPPQGPTELITMASRASGSASEFYGYLYVGLYYEAERNEEKAKEYLLKAVESQYAKLSGDYMAALAKVHCSVRGWRPL